MKPQYQTAVTTLQTAARALSGVCDGAATLDGQGFNGLDSHFGKSLAAQERWSPKQAVAAQKMLRKYAGQLSGYGIDLTTVPPLTVEELMDEQTAARPKTNIVDFNPATTAFEFWFDYDYDQKEYIKRQLKAFFRKDGRGCYWNLTESRADFTELAKYIEQYQPTITEAAQAHLTAPAPLTATAFAQDTAPAPVANATDASIELSKAEDADLSAYDMTGFQLVPYNFQKAGALYGLLKKKVIIGDDMGLGKTIQALLIAHLSGAADRMIVMCPASVKINWSRETHRAMPHLTYDIWDGKGGRADVNVIIINYDNLKKNLAKLKAFGPRIVVIDEIHYLKSSKAQRTQAAQALLEDVEYAIGLTGTPILNRPDELVSPLTLLGRIDEFGGWFEFVQRYCAAYYKHIWIKGKYGTPFQKRILDTSGSSNLEELNAKLRAVCMVRRKKLDVLKDMPAKQRAQVVFPITNRKEYISAQTNLINYVKACAAEDKAFLATIAHLKGAERTEAIREHQADKAQGAERAEQLVMMETLKQLAVEGKLEAVIEWIQNFLESGEKLIVFATHIDVQNRLCEAFRGRSAKIMGEDGGEARQAAVDRFKTDPKCDLIVCSLIAGGQGVDGMQNACSNVAFVELGWTPAMHLQAEDRAHRIGQAGQVTCYYLLAEDTIEETIQTMLAKKQAVCDSVLDGADEMKDGSIFNELLDVIMSGAPDKCKR